MYVGRPDLEVTTGTYIKQNDQIFYSHSNRTMAQLSQVTSSVEHLNFMGQILMSVQNVTSLLLMGISERIKGLQRVVRDALLRYVAAHHSDLRHGHHVVPPLLGAGEAGRPDVERHHLLAVDQEVLPDGERDRLGRVPVLFAYFDLTAGQTDLKHWTEIISGAGWTESKNYTDILKFYTFCLALAVAPT